MKYILIIYTIISVAMLAYFLLTATGYYLKDYWMMLILVVNAIFVVPINMNRKLDDRERKSFTKMLAILSVALISFGTLFAHVGTLWATESLSVLFAWFGNIIFIPLLIITTILYKKINDTIEGISNLKHQFSNFMFSLFYIILITWACMIIIDTILAML